LCALFFPNKKKYDIFLSESMREPLLVMKAFGLMKKRQKLIALMGNETVYFYVSGYYSKKVKWLIKKYFEKCDAILCIGNFQLELIKTILPPGHHKKLWQINNWLSQDLSEQLGQIQPDLNSDNILFIGDIGADFRAWYKGLDVLIKSFGIAAGKNEKIKLIILGAGSREIADRYKSVLPQNVADRIIVHGRQPIIPHLSAASLYLHCARGEAWGMSIMEALQAGVPVICSDLTGAKEIVEQVSPDMVLALDPERIASQINRYFQLDASEKKRLSEAGRNVMRNYSEKESIERFKSVYQNIVSGFEK
jgi:glycosyltransferase involved in cell wall biosynthesis